MQSVVDGLKADEHVVPLEAVLRDAQRNAYRLLAAAPPRRDGAGDGGGGDRRDDSSEGSTDRQGGSQSTSQGDSRPDGSDVLDQKSLDALPLDEAKTALDELRSRFEAEPGARLTISWRLTRPGR